MRGDRPRTEPPPDREARSIGDSSIRLNEGKIDENPAAADLSLTEDDMDGGLYTLEGIWEK